MFINNIFVFLDSLLIFDGNKGSLFKRGVFGSNLLRKR